MPYYKGGLLEFLMLIIIAVISIVFCIMIVVIK